MGLLDQAPPRTVEVCGRDVPVAWDWRTGVRVERADASDARGRLRVLRMLYGAALPEPVAEDPAGAYEAGVAWHNAGWACMRYGRGRKRPQAAVARRLLDWDADAAVVASDFQRLYRIDMTDPGCRMHWWRFCALVLGAARTSGSLLSQALGSRSASLVGLKGQERRRAERRRDAWALPPTAAEMRARAEAEFGRG